MSNKKIKKVLLITPPYHSGVVECAGRWLPLGFVYIAGALRDAGFEPVIYDAMSEFHNHEEIRKRILDEKPDVVATTAFTAAVNDSLKILSDAKDIDERIVTVIGGIHPTFLYRDILSRCPFVDFAVRGEGEITFVELLDCLNSGKNLQKVKSIAYWSDGGTVVTPARAFIENLDNLSPAWDLINWKIYNYRVKENSTLAIVSSSRGCTQGCLFCSQQVFWKKTWRARSAKNFVDELVSLRERFSVNVAMICDEFPTSDRIRWELILDQLIERRPGIDLLMETRVDDIVRDESIMGKYRDAGISHIYVGVESVDQKTLNEFNKNIKVEESKKAIDIINRHGMISETSFVLGMPGDTLESIKNTLELAKHYNPDMAFFLAIAPWPYSEIYTTLKPYIFTYDYSKYNLIEPVITPENMTVDELKECLLKTTEEFFKWKFQNLGKLSPEKQEFMKKVMKILIKYSYLGEIMRERFRDTRDIPDAMTSMDPGIIELFT
ncbi:MAG TPA: radical SAM protein [bacterium]